MSLIKTITKNLLERDYRVVENLSDGHSVNDDLTHITFLKGYGTVLYGIGLINCARVSDYKAVYTALSEHFSLFSNNRRYTSYVFVGLFLSTGGDDELVDFCTYNIEDYSERITEVRWLIDTAQRRVIVNGQQPNKIMDLQEQLSRALKADYGGNCVDESIGDLVNNEVEKRKESIKSSNIILTFVLILINTVMLILTYLSGGLDESDIMKYGQMSSDAVFGMGEYYRLYTSMFLHYGIAHLASNALFLYVFGSSVERYYGKLKFLFIYLCSGLVGGLVFCLFSEGVAVGASAAVFGLVGAMLSYSLKVKRSVDGRDTYFMILFAVISICSGFLSDNIANSAHIGGFICGALAGFVLSD
jgi:membrane associated rhomboid family serine protease